MSSASHPRTEIRAEAYRSMANAHGQLCHVSAAVCQVHVVEQTRVRPARKEKVAHRPSVSSGFLPTGGQFVEISQSAKTEYRGELVNTFYPTNDPQTIAFRESHFHEPPYGDNGQRGTICEGAVGLCEAQSSARSQARKLLLFAP